MANYTPRLGLRVDNENDPLWAARENWDRLDNTFTGVLWVTPGTIPSSDLLYDGAMVAEIGNGKVWRAEKNAGGTFDRKWIKYPWQITVSGAGNFPPVGITPANWGYDSIDFAQSYNATDANLQGTQIVVPVSGLYRGVQHWRWENGGPIGWKSYQTLFNDTYDPADSETVKIATTFGNMSIHQYRIQREMAAGDRVAGAAWRDTAGACPYTHRCALQLVRPY